MAPIEWGGRTWVPSTPPPSAAILFARLAAPDTAGAATQVMDELLEVLLDRRQRILLDDGLAEGTLPGDVDKLASQLVMGSSGRPFAAVASLSVSTVRTWSVVRGQLGRSGITRPLEDLPSLWALLDVTESLILDGKDEKGRDAYLSRMYPATQSAGARGWSDAEEAATWSAFTAGIG